MGSFILCHKKKAKHPYEIIRIHKNIYTLEELCFYLCNHIYLIDHTIMNKNICDWLSSELELTKLSEKLLQLIDGQGSIEEFICEILSASSIYTADELKKMQAVLEKLKNQKPIEKQKCKADNLMESGSIPAAISLYQAIIHGERDESMDGKFYGRVYGCLGAAYGKMFLYEDAAKMYEAAFQICEEESMLKAYLYASKQYLKQEKYQEVVGKSAMFQKVDQELQDEIRRIENEEQTISYEDTFEEWKETYRLISTGAI